ncbi:MAG TPA: zf-HC2 domain-containing protein, partial [Planctomycetota bacterium]|nr:zf-HC2 domain-containing protein [Planctomycetota bacterium]
MNCAFDKEKLSGYYDGELDAAEKAEVERHIASCSECLRELGELKSSALLVKELPRLRAPRSIAEGVAREIQTAGKVHQFAKVRRSVLWAAAAAAGIFVVLNVAYFIRAERPSGDPAVVAKP